MRFVAFGMLTVLCAFGALAAPVELLPFVMSSGTQYADTGYVPHARKTRATVRFHLLERSAAHIGLFGTFAVTGKSIDFTDYKNCAITIGNRSNGNFVFLPNWCGSTSDGYLYPVTGSADSNVAYIASFRLANGSINNGACGYNSKTGKGYYDDYRVDAYLPATATMYIGDVNDGGGSPMTASGARVKARWYEFKIFEDEVLLHDFVPARQGTSVGFYDTVEKVFIASKTDPFLAPEHFTLKTPAAGTRYDFGSASSYVGDVLPGRNGVIDVPAATEICARFEDTPVLNDFAGIDLLDASSVFAFTNCTWASQEYSREINWSKLTAGTTMRFSLFGTGTFMCRDSLPTAERALFALGDSYGFEGRVVVSNAPMRVIFRYGIGGPDTHVYYNSVNGTGGNDTRRFTVNSGNRYPFAFHYVSGANMYISGAAAYQEGPVYLEAVKAGNLTFHGNNLPLYVNGPVYAPLTGRKILYLNAGACLTGADKYLGDYWIQHTASGSPDVGAHVHFNRTPWNSNCTLQMNVGGNCNQRLRATVENCFDATTYLMLRYTQTGANAGNSRFDLNGLDQQLGILGMYTDANLDPDTQWDATTCVTSGVPAKLTIYECCRNGRGGKWKSYFPALVRGAASIVLNSTNSLSNATALERAITFSAPGSDTTGGLYARRGTIRVVSTGSFPNLTHLEATGEGVLDLQTSEIGTEAAALRVVCTNRAEGATVSINLAEGVTIAADTANVGDNHWLDTGTYGSAEAVAAAGTGIVCPHLSGLGFLTVRRYGGTTGFSIFFH